RHVLVDTSGLVEGDLGRALKRLKIDRVAPNHLIALQRERECEALLESYARPQGPAILGLLAAAPRRRSPAVRRRVRETALAAHLAGATPVGFDLTRVEVGVAPDAPGLAVIDVVGMLAGLA